VVVGDQLFTDVLAAKLLGMRAILVSPIVAREHWLMSLVRRIERLLVAGPAQSAAPDHPIGTEVPFERLPRG
jgi:predicted HAD superfamily phosphohydrolase YqeG